MLALLARAGIFLVEARKMKMTSLSVRKLDDKVCECLRLLAAKHGISMEQEARQIITQVVVAPQRISAVFSKCFGPKNGINLELESRKPHQPMDLGE